MSIYWPATFPQVQFLGLSYAPQDQTVRSAMDAGPPKVRRRFTAAVVQQTIPVRFTGAQLRAFLVWFNGTLGGGALAFVWRNAATGAQVEMRFLKPPEWTPVVGSKIPERQQWSSSLPLEILP